MVLNIAGKECELHFGLKFLRELDKNNFIEQNGVRFGAGLQLKGAELLDNNIVALSDIIWTATNTLSNRPTQGQVDEFVENHNDVEGLIKDIIKELEEGKVTAPKMKELTGAIESVTGNPM